MDKIWYRHPSKLEVIGRCGGMKKTNDHAEPTKVERYKKNHKKNRHALIKVIYKFGRSSDKNRKFCTYLRIHDYLMLNLP